MNYNDALNEAKRAGASKVEGLGLLAITCESLSKIHAINPENTYKAAVCLKMTAKQVRQLPLNDLAFLQFS